VFGMQSIKVQKMDESKIYTFDSTMGFWGIPNIRRKIQFEQRPNVDIEVAHNDQGLRDAPFNPSDPKGTILCIGGSHTWGGGVAQEERYTDLLARRTGRQVVNMGHCSLGIDQAALAILKLSRQYNPETIVVEQYPWAVVRILRGCVNKEYVKPSFFLDQNGQLKLNKIPWAARFPLLRKLIGLFYTYLKELREFREGIDLHEGYDPLADPMFLYWKISQYDYLYALLEKIILMINDYCTQNRIHLLFTLGVAQQRFNGSGKSRLVDYDLPRKRLRNILDKSGIAYVDMADVMLEEHSDADPVIFNDGHINLKGHRIFATALQRGLEARGWI